MAVHTLRHLAADEAGHGVITYIMVAGSFSVLVFQPSLIVAAIDRFYSLAALFVGQLGFAF